jgi:hypothetical protein
MRAGAVLAVRGMMRDDSRTQKRRNDAGSIIVLLRRGHVEREYFQ